MESNTCHLNGVFLMRKIRTWPWYNWNQLCPALWLIAEDWIMDHHATNWTLMAMFLTLLICSWSRWRGMWFQWIVKTNASRGDFHFPLQLAGARERLKLAYEMSIISGLMLAFSPWCNSTTANLQHWYCTFFLIGPFIYY